MVRRMPAFRDNIPWSDSQLNDFRLEGDPLADAVIDRILENDGPVSCTKLFHRIIRNIESPLDEIEKYAPEFLDSTERLPVWVNKSDVQLCQEMFLRHGRKFLTILYFKSLPLLYYNHKGAEVLVTTARLIHRADRSDIYARRIAETGKFLLYVLKPNRLDPGTIGIRTIQKVRLIHAFNRGFLVRGQWDTGTFGLPINQEDMVMTLMCFNLILLEGLKQFGISESRERRDGFYKTWLGIGALMGVVPELLPENQQSGRQLLEKILRRHGKESKAGNELTRALIIFAKNYMPKWIVNAPEAFIRYFDPEVATELLGKRNGNLFNRSLFPHFLRIFFSMEHKLKMKSPGIYKYSLAGRTRRMMKNFDRASKSIDEQ